MPFLRRFFNFYLDASIHVALAVVALYFVTVEVLKVSTNWQLALFLFFGTIVCYNFIKFGVEAEKYLIVSNPYHKLIQGFSFISFAIAAYFFFQLDEDVWLAVLGLTTVSALYAVPLLPKLKNLRSLGGLKTFLVAFVWMGSTVLLPVIDNQIAIVWDTNILMAQRFLLVLILLLPFEIRDMKYDNPELKTLPQRIGVNNTKVLGYILIVFYFFSSFLKDEIGHRWIIECGIVSLVLILVLIKTKQNQSRYFSSFWVEAIPLGYVLILHLRNLF
ncbi:hypothetical protein MTsPCn9_27130 [Croceitalea sp. MTPC9]|uniref:hypothetical protein n=1 Tax=unclassified Croceitalea TaxID=2632280 RepID=UPI002B39323E|nr:hypothetical protein MTsPCn6_23050 [Croceitalea sp. MTPC6]GMN17775.1 hypothetical protein MTsPCn9_27130 [Croceitalea sp. MTPC9]